MGQIGKLASAWTSKPTNLILFTDRLLSLVALRFGLTDSQRNSRAAHRSRSFHGDNQKALAKISAGLGQFHSSS
jgi:hypothetical protein